MKVLQLFPVSIGLQLYHVSCILIGSKPRQPKEMFKTFRVDEMFRYYM